MANYTKEQIEGFNAKDKRISFLSIFSSLCNLQAGNHSSGVILEQTAHEINERLYEKYPFVEENTNERPL